MLNEIEFLDSYRLAVKARQRGEETEAREILFLLFEHGRHIAGCGAVRLTFVLDDLAALARVGRRRRDDAARHTLDRLTGIRDDRERSTRAGEAAFVEIQELVALNRALGQPERSYSLLRQLRSEVAGRGEGGAARGEGRAQAAHYLADLLEDDETLYSSPDRLAQAIFHHRLRGHLSDLTRTVHELLEISPLDVLTAEPSTDEERLAGQRDRERLDVLSRDLEDLAAACRGTALHFHDPDAGTVGRPRPELDPAIRDRVAELARDTFLLLDQPRLRVRLVEIDLEVDVVSGREVLRREVRRLTELARRARALSVRHGLDGDAERSADLERRLVAMAADVAEAIAEHRIWEDFLDTVDDARQPLEEYLEKKIRLDGLMVFQVFLRLDRVDLAERLANWLLAFRQDETMYRDLLTAARGSGHPDLEHRLAAEAQRL